jgi:hypothetical protein
MTIRRKFFPAVVTEYVAGLYASGLLGRTLVPLIALAFTVAFIVGLLDAVSGWRLHIPLWAHIASTLVFVAVVGKLVAGHIRNTCEAGRRFLSRRSEA